MNESNRHMLEQLERTAHDMLSHIEQLKAARAEPDVAHAQENLYADAVAMRTQSHALEQHLEEQSQRVYLGG
jgi:hypothetical protein